MKVLAIVALLFAASEAVRRPVPYDVYVALGGLPLPEALRTNGQKWYAPDFDTSSNSSSKIVGGSSATLAQFPWIISLRRTSHSCGGSMLDSTTIVTAAHCVSGVSASSLSVRYGSVNHGSGGTIVQVSKVTAHPSYSSSTIDYDIAILKLSSAITGSTNSPVSLPAQGSDPTEGTNVICAGWGTTSESGSLSSSLLQVTVPIVGRTKCRSQYGTSSITDRMICAGVDAGGKDACQGDSGGPLTQGSTLVGVVSWGYGCARPNYAGVYARVGALRTWIDNNRG